MALYAVTNACYTPIGSIPYSLARHPLLSCKASEKPLTVYCYRHIPNFAIFEIAKMLIVPFQKLGTFLQGTRHLSPRNQAFFCRKGRWHL